MGCTGFAILSVGLFECLLLLLAQPTPVHLELTCFSVHCSRGCLCFFIMIDPSVDPFPLYPSLPHPPPSRSLLESAQLDFSSLGVHDGWSFIALFVNSSSGSSCSMWLPSNAKGNKLRFGKNSQTTRIPHYTIERVYGPFSKVRLTQTFFRQKHFCMPSGGYCGCRYSDPSPLLVIHIYQISILLSLDLVHINLTSFAFC